MFVKDLIQVGLNKMIESIKQDAIDKDQKIPVKSFRTEVNEEGGKLYAAHYMQYLLLGRGPGKQPPPDAMLKFVQSNPEMFESAKQRFANITEKGLAYLIGRKIGREGTDIYTGKKKGVDINKAIEDNLPALLIDLARNQVVNIQTSLKSAL